jgi:hypothetical protein
MRTLKLKASLMETNTEIKGTLIDVPWLGTLDTGQPNEVTKINVIETDNNQVQLSPTPSLAASMASTTTSAMTSTTRGPTSQYKVRPQFKHFRKKRYHVKPAYEYEYELETGGDNIRHKDESNIPHHTPHFYGYCYNCDYARHSQNFCPLKRCSLCHHYGHSSKVCPDNNPWSNSDWRQKGCVRVPFSTWNR